MGWFDFWGGKKESGEKKEQNSATKDKFENTSGQLNSTLSDFQKLLIDIERQRREIEGEPPLSPDDPLLNIGKEKDTGGVGTDSETSSASSSELNPSSSNKKPETKFYYYTDENGNIRKTTDFMFWYEDHGQGAVDRGFKDQVTTVSSETIKDPSSIPSETDEIKTREVSTDVFKIKTKRRTTGDILYETAVMMEREQALKRKIVPKAKKEAKASYKPKREVVKNIKENPFNVIYNDANSYLNNALAWIKDPSKKEDKFSLYLNPEDELKFKETNRNTFDLKIEERKFTEIEKDILQSMIDDIADVTNYLRIIDKTYSSKNNGILNVLENLKRKQKKSNLTPEFLTSNLPLITADGKPKENSRINILRESDPENTNEKPKVQSIKVRYENKLNKKGKKIPVIDFQKVFENGTDNAVLYRGPMIEPTTDKQLLKINKELFKKIRKAAPNYKWKM